MKTFKSLVALAVMASLTFNALNAHASVYNESVTGAFTDASGNAMIRVTAVGNFPTTTIVVSPTCPVFNSHDDVTNAGIETLTIPTLSGINTYLAHTLAIPGHSWVFVVTGLHTPDQKVQVFYAY